MANTTLRNKEIDKAWTAVEALLKVDGSKTVSIPHQTRYNIWASGFALAMVLQPGTSFSLSKRTVGGWALSYASGNLTWTVYNATTSLSVSAAVSATVKSFVIPYVTASGTIGIYINGEQVAVSGSTITGDFSNTADITLSGNCLIGLLSVSSKAPSDLEIRARVNPNFGELAIIPATMHPYIQGYWTCQDKTGNKLYDSVEYFNSGKSVLIPPLHPRTNWNNFNPTGPEIAYSETATYLQMESVAIPSGNYPANYFMPIAINFVGGRTYRMEIDSEIISGTPGNTVLSFIINGTTYKYEKSNYARETIIYEFTPPANQAGQFYMEARFWGNGSVVRIYSAKLFDKIIGWAIDGNHATPTGYSDTELGITDKTTQTARVSFYDKTTTSFWDGSGNELRTGFPDLVNALLIDATHTISFPLSGTVTLSYKGYGVIAYRLKSGQTLTTLETKWLEKNLLFGNPNPAIVRKLDAFYHLGNVNSGTLEVQNLLSGSNHATVSSNYSTVTINSLR